MYEVMGWPGPLTHRQFEAFCTWESSQWNKPSRSDWYAMQVAFYVACSNAKDPRSIKFERMRLKFREAGTTPTLSREQAAKYAKAASLARLGATQVQLPDGRMVSARDIINGDLERAASAIQDAESSD